MAKKHFIKSTSVTVRDTNGNTITADEQKIHSITLGDSDYFHMVYLRMFKTFYEIKYVKDVMLLFRLCDMAQFNTGHVSLSAKDRRDLCAFLNMQNSNLSSSLKRLNELGLLNGEMGSYIINEAVFWRGDNSTRNKILKERGLDFIVRFVLESDVKPTADMPVQEN